ncbi:MAG: Flp pilus assembly protein CpaB [Myxococcota bacterium]
MAKNQTTTQPMVFIALAGLVVAGGGYGLYTYFSGMENEVQAVQESMRGDTIPVVLASRDLYQGVQINEDDLFVLDMPRKYLPRLTDPESGEVSFIEFFSSMDRVISQVPRERILKNEVVRPERLADGSSGIGFNAMINRGMRAISINLRGAKALSGLLEPGNQVDILVTMETTNGESRTETILQSVVILGVDSRAEDENEATVETRGKQKPAVTFLVTPEQAEEIAYADELGTISLALRNVTDQTTSELNGVDLDVLLGRIRNAPVPVKIAPRAAKAAPAPTAGPTITIIRGSSRSEEQIREKPDAL